MFSERLINGIAQLKHVIAAKFNESVSDSQEELSKRADKVVKSATSKLYWFCNLTFYMYMFDR